MNAAVLNAKVATKLDLGEAHHRIESPNPGLSLFLRHLPPPNATAADHRAVLYVHGGTFPSALSIAHRFDGRSWRDALCDAGFHVWGLDFHGFGLFDPYPDMTQPADGWHRSAGPTSPAGRSRLRCALSRLHGPARISIVAHSWGTWSPAARGPAPGIDRPAGAVRPGPAAAQGRGAAASRLALISLQDQWTASPRRCRRSRTRAAAPPFRRMGRTLSRLRPRQPDALTRGGEGAERAFPDIFDAWAASCPTIRTGPGAGRDHPRRMGQLLQRCRARWLFDALPASPVKRDVKISRGTHLMHLETMRTALYRESIAFLAEPALAPGPRPDLAPPKTKRRTHVRRDLRSPAEAGTLDDYLALAKSPEAEARGDRRLHRQRALPQPARRGRLLSLSTWRDEKALIRWRTHGDHHGVQEKGRFEVFEDYHLRVGEVFAGHAAPPASTRAAPRRDRGRRRQGRHRHRGASRTRKADVSADTLARPRGRLRRPGRRRPRAVREHLRPGKLLLLVSWRGAARPPGHFWPSRRPGAQPPRHRRSASSGTTACSTAAKRRSSIAKRGRHRAPSWLARCRNCRAV